MSDNTHDNGDKNSNNEGKENLESYIMLEGDELEDTSYLQAQFQLSFNLNGLILTASSFSSTFDALNPANNSASNDNDNIVNNGEEYQGVFSAREIEDKINEVLSNVCILNQDGVIIFTNQSWNQFSNTNGGQDCKSKTSDIGSNYLRICRQAANAAKDDCVRTNAKAFYEGLTRLIDAETTEEFTLIYPCDSPTEKRWYLARAFTFHLSEGVQRTIISHQYISDSDKQNNDGKNNKNKTNNPPQCSKNNNCNNEIHKDDCELNSNPTDSTGKLSGKRSNDQEDFSQRKLFKHDDSSDNNVGGNENNDNSNDNDNNENKNNENNNDNSDEKENG